MKHTSLCRSNDKNSNGTKIDINIYQSYNTGNGMWWLEVANILAGQLYILLTNYK